MSSIARLETTYAYNKQKVVIDVADLMNIVSYYEAIGMSPDGRMKMIKSQRSPPKPMRPS